MIDVIIICVFALRIFAGRKAGIWSEFVGVIGACVAIFTTLHYYSGLAKFFKSVYLIKTFPVEMIAVIVIFGSVMFLFYILQEAWGAVFRLEIPGTINKRVGLVLATGNAFLLSALIFFSIIAIKDSAAVKLAQRSYSKKIFSRIALNIYSTGYEYIIKRIFPAEEANAQAYVAVDRLVAMDSDV
ncbi:MAG: CvpA family protein [Candidatus Omnitrophica bacterium]|nr:CvpA family protein [Candidatus Omnitrophota bacterium]